MTDAAKTTAWKPTHDGQQTRPPVIEVDHLDWSFGAHQVLFDVSMKVHEGEIMVIMGGSGSGKTTLLRHMVGLMPPIPGKVKLMGQDMAELDALERLELRRKIGVAFQFGALFTSMSVAENVKLPLRELTHLDENTMDIMARLKLEVVGLSGSGNLMPAELSGGMMKRVSIARAIAMDPKLLFLDEPSSGLDPAISSTIDDLILRLREAMGISIVVVTHDVESAFKIADRIAILDHGHIIACQAPDQIRVNQDERVQNLIHRHAEHVELDPEEYLRRLTGM
jgi:phospholipid/cholesterol/gamma-HCH transport system ATP-binding protein